MESLYQALSLKTCLCLEYIDLSTMNEMASYFFNDINIQHVDLKVFGTASLQVCGLCCREQKSTMFSTKYSTGIRAEWCCSCCSLLCALLVLIDLSQLPLASIFFLLCNQLLPVMISFYCCMIGTIF